MSDLDQEISAYERMRDEIKRAHGSVWAMVRGQRLVRTFPDFSAAARYAVENFNGEQVLIRHIDERLESAPFVGITG